MALKRSGSPRTARDVTPEIARKRLEELTPYHRIALRAFILAVAKGWGLPRKWDRQALENIVAEADTTDEAAEFGVGHDEEGTAAPVRDASSIGTSRTRRGKRLCVLSDRTS